MNAPLRTDPMLSGFEATALRIGELVNEQPGLKRLQRSFLHRVSQPWVREVVRRRTLVDGVEWLVDLEPDQGVILASNHRSFFDQYIAMLALYESGARWPRRLYFPVRANFFYERPLGLLINLLIGGGAMYPPVYRERSRARLNRQALDRLVGYLQRPGTLVGMHPEGTRGKGPDPYELLPAQPGVGEVILRAKPLVVPLFIGGLGNDFLSEARLNFRREARRIKPLILSFGQPVDYSAFTQEPPRAALAKRTADTVRDAIADCGRRERELRRACIERRLLDDDPAWLSNRIRRRRARRRTLA